MLYARRQRGRTYDVTGDHGVPVTVWNPLNWRKGGQFVLNGWVFTVRPVGWGSGRVQLFGPSGAELALAAAASARRWSVVTHDGTYRFRAAGLEQRLIVDDRAVGFVRRGRAAGPLGADAYLPGMPTLVAVFTIAVALMDWANAEAATAAAALNASVLGSFAAGGSSSASGSPPAGGAGSG